MALNIPLVLQAVLNDYTLPFNGDHGVAHWARVLENGLRLTEETGANIEVVSLFAVLHDSRRMNEHTDHDHGLRAAKFAGELRGNVFDLNDHEFRLLYRACEGHTHERTHPDATIQTCWDSDRLDLGRVGITPHPSRLGKPAYLKVERRYSAFDDPALTRWTFYTHRDGLWFAVSYFVAEAHDEIPAMARRYLETVRIAADK